MKIVKETEEFVKQAAETNTITAIQYVMDHLKQIFKIARMNCNATLTNANLHLKNVKHVVQERHNASVNAWREDAIATQKLYAITNYANQQFNNIGQANATRIARNQSKTVSMHQMHGLNGA